MATQAITARPEDLRAAAQILRQRGHTTGTYAESATGPVCLVGALRIAIAGTPHFNAEHVEPALRTRALLAEAAVGQYLERRGLLEGDTFVPQWNDERCTGGDEAVAVLEAFAAELEADGS